MKIGDKLTGRITGIQPYGAFVELETGVTGLIHISEIRTGFIENIYDILKIGDEVQVQVVDFDEYTGKASLSIRTFCPNDACLDAWGIRAFKEEAINTII